MTAGLAGLRLLPAETAHDWTLAALERLPRRTPPPDPAGLAVSLAGLSLTNPIGLAAGFDKDARVADAMFGLGFGFVEVGSVTPEPQPGNPKPRAFRLAHDRAVINRYGFNSQGLDQVAARLQARAGRPGVLGANLGANKTSADRIGDYVTGLKRLYPFVQFVTVNISSPNTEALRELQGEASVNELLARVMAARALMATDHGSKPVFLKVAPDLDAEGIDIIAQAATRHHVDALVIANTTIARPKSLTSAAKGEAGGLSGAPLFAPSTETLKAFYRRLGGATPLIGVGGVGSADQAYAKIRAGASAIQLYTALVYEGPGLVARIKAGLATRLARDGFDTLAQAVGTAVN